MSRAQVLIFFLSRESKRKQDFYFTDKETKTYNDSVTKLQLYFLVLPLTHWIRSLSRNKLKENENIMYT